MDSKAYSKDHSKIPTDGFNLQLSVSKIIMEILLENLMNYASVHLINHRTQLNLETQQCEDLE